MCRSGARFVSYRHTLAKRPPLLCPVESKASAGGYPWPALCHPGTRSLCILGILRYNLAQITHAQVIVVILSYSSAGPLPAGECRG